MQARFASVDITPARSCALAGFPQRQGEFTGIHDPLEINAIFFTDAAQSVLLVSVDTLYAGEALKVHIQAEAKAHLGVAAVHVLVCASHTHFAPSLDRKKPRLAAMSEDYCAMVRARASKLVQDLASQQAQDIRIGTASMVTDRAINRRRHWPYPVLTRSGPKLSAVVLAPSDGYCENRIRSLWVHNQDGKLLCAIWNYACHPVCFPRADMVSAEYPGVVRAAIRAEAGNVPVLFLQGFCGDIRPNVPSRGGFVAALKKIVMGPRFGRFQYKEWQDWASGIAAVVLRTRAEARDANLQGLETAAGQIPIGEIFKGAANSGDIECYRLSLGDDLKLFTVSAEPVAELGPMVADDVILVGYEGDVFGYLPTDKIISEGGYEGAGFLSLFHLDGHLVGNVDRSFSRAASQCGVGATVRSGKVSPFP